MFGSCSGKDILNVALKTLITWFVDARGALTTLYDIRMQLESHLSKSSPLNDVKIEVYLNDICPEITFRNAIMLKLLDRISRYDFMEFVKCCEGTKRELKPKESTMVTDFLLLHYTMFMNTMPSFLREELAKLVKEIRDDLEATGTLFAASHKGKKWMEYIDTGDVNMAKSIAKHVLDCPTTGIDVQSHHKLSYQGKLPL